jgi:hypothetical protein
MAWQVRCHEKVLSDLKKKGAEFHGERAVAPSLSHFLGLSMFFTKKGFKDIVLWGPQFTSRDVQSLRALMGVESIGIIEVPVSVGDFTALKRLSGLRALTIGGSAIRDDLVDEIIGLPNVRFLVLADTGLTGGAYEQVKRAYAMRSGCARTSLEELRDAYSGLFHH